MLAWHFLNTDCSLQYSPRTPVVEGVTYSAQGPLILCENGMHASKDILDALKYAPGPILCRVFLSGQIIHGHDKCVAESRKPIWMKNIDRLLHEFACQCAEDVLYLNNDKRLTTAIEAKRKWLNSTISDAELFAARAAAWDAARDAAGAAARAAATAAATAAAWDAARDAAWDAARAAAWDAATAAAWDAARHKQRKRLLSMISQERIHNRSVRKG